MAYKQVFNKDGKFSHALKNGATVFVRDLNGTPNTPVSKYDPATHQLAADFLATNPDLRDRAATQEPPILNWDSIIDGLLVNAAFWDIFSRYEGLNLSPRKRLNANSTQLMLLRIPGVLPQFMAGWNGIITEIRANVLAVKPSAAEIASINAVLSGGNAPFRMDGQGFMVMS